MNLGVASLKQFRLPDVGEGLTEAEILRWLVGPGDVVTQNQTIIEIETAKAVVELPSPFAGVVSELLVEEGATVTVGTPIITVDVSTTESVIQPPTALTPTRAAVLVGYGPVHDAPARRRPRHSSAALARPDLHGAEALHAVEALHTVASSRPDTAPSALTLAKPPVRKLARDLGIDLDVVRGSGPDGAVTRSDVEAAADLSRIGAPSRPLPRAGEERVPIRGVRKAMAEAMANSIRTVPHVTEFTTIDVTRSMRAVTRLRLLPEFADIKVTPLLLVAKAVLLAIERFPLINSTWDDHNSEIIVKHYVNLGIAAATPRGLVVPNIKNAEALSLSQLGRSIGVLATTAREGRTSVADMQHGTFTITNVGVFGIDTGTPIINPGETAVLAVGAISERPWLHRGKVKPRYVTTLALSFDHRSIDGELGSRFLRDIALFLEDPASSLIARL
jgi:2-oxoisovalerate dehydrogenase E2 component (dihydrolipoyl transacylase)